MHRKPQQLQLMVGERWLLFTFISVHAGNWTQPPEPEHSIILSEQLIMILLLFLCVKFRDKNAPKETIYQPLKFVKRKNCEHQFWYVFLCTFSKYLTLETLALHTKRKLISNFWTWNIMRYPHFEYLKFDASTPLAHVFRWNDLKNQRRVVKWLRWAACERREAQGVDIAHNINKSKKWNRLDSLIDDNLYWNNCRRAFGQLLLLFQWLHALDSEPYPPPPPHTHTHTSRPVTLEVIRTR